MMKWAIYSMVYVGSALMVYNIYGFVSYARRLQSKKDWGRERIILYVPIALLVMFLLGYLAVGLLGKPDLIVSGILFGGSIFVCIMYLLIERITDRIQKSEQMEAKLIAAEASNQAKTDFLATMSHEMRTPMNVIIGLDSIALQDGSLSRTTRDRLEKIGVSARHLLELIDDVLDMNLLESGQAELKIAPFSLRETLEVIGLLVQSRCDDKGLEYRHDVPEDLCDRCVGDAFRLKQVLLSILDNAVKFTAAPGTVTFSAEQENAPQGRCALRFTVSDTGIGMEESFIPKLFGSFTQEDASATSSFGGSGLGLAITKRLVDMMDGEITAWSKKGEGSRFTVTVTLDEAPAAEAEDSEGDGDGMAVLRGRRMLIVEDIDLNADILADLLEMEDILSERAENGQIAVDMFSRNPPGYYAAILMDLRMPVMDGLEATRTIRALDRPDAGTIPIVAVTANASEQDVKHSLEAGMNAHVAKPADTDLLYATLGRLVGQEAQKQST